MWPCRPPHAPRPTPQPRALAHATHPLLPHANHKTVSTTSAPLTEPNTSESCGASLSLSLSLTHSLYLSLSHSQPSPVPSPPKVSSLLAARTVMPVAPRAALLARPLVAQSFRRGFCSMQVGKRDALTPALLLPSPHPHPHPHPYPYPHPYPHPCPALVASPFRRRLSPCREASHPTPAPNPYPNPQQNPHHNPHPNPIITPP